MWWEWCPDLPLVHVVLGVVQPHPDLHHVPLPDKVEDVLHVLCVGPSPSPSCTRRQARPGVSPSHSQSQSAQVLLLKTGQPWIRSLYFLARHWDRVRLTEVPGTSPCVDLVFTWQSPGEVPVVTVVPCDDVRQCRVRGEVRGDVSVSTGRVEPHYWEHLSPLHQTRVTWWPETTLTHHVRLGSNTDYICTSCCLVLLLSTLYYNVLM